MTPLKYTQQELADALQAPIAMQSNNTWWAFPEGAKCRSYGWVPEGDVWAQIPLNPTLFEITDPPDNWQESLTPPRTEAEPEVCEWRKLPGFHWYQTDCPKVDNTDGVIAGIEAEEFVYCPYCSRLIRIVEDSDDTQR